jgi:succinate-semialdehyde dehydrogenase/glutarate-semialdehyde dehydrogenase
MVLKPAKETPLSAFALAQILLDSGLPAGVLNIVCGSSAGAIVGPLMEDPRARKISFTGSTEVGQMLIEQSAKRVLRVSMELGGNAPFLVFEDADIDAAVDGAVIAKMRNNGEACTAANRFHVHESVAREFAQKFADRLGSMKIGRGVEEEVQVGPLINENQRKIVEDLVQDATAKGAKVLVGGERLDGPGFFYPPTVLDEVPKNARILSEEIFGPVAPITTFSTDDEAIAAANDTDFGLVAYIYTRNLARAMRTIEALDTGMVGVNRGVVSNPGAPFGGVKMSGYGREGGFEGINEYLEVKYAALSL